MAKPISKELAADMKAEIAFLEGMSTRLTLFTIDDMLDEESQPVDPKDLAAMKEAEAKGMEEDAKLGWPFQAMSRFITARVEGDGEAVAAAKRDVERLMHEMKDADSPVNKLEPQGYARNMQAAWLVAQADELVTHQEAKMLVQSPTKRAKN